MPRQNRDCAALRLATADEKRLVAAAGEATFARGEDYVRYIRALRVVGSWATASMQGRRVYRVELDWSNVDLDGRCTCPHFGEGAFYKHLVAVGLMVVDGGKGGEPQVDATSPTRSSPWMRRSCA